MGGATNDDVQVLDALVVGAGFGGVWQLKKLRDEGYQVKLVEAGGDYGGVWYWNRYPGARVDVPIPIYEFDDPALWKNWTWKQRYPGSEELRAYFAHIAKTWDLRKDTQFNAFVQSAVWDDGESRWIVKIKEGSTFKVKFLSLNVGFAAKRYIPDWPGVDSFKGTFLHPSCWPYEGLGMKGKKVAVIGTGATGVQIAQTISSEVDELVVFQRTLNTCLPMDQRNYDTEIGEQAASHEKYPEIFKSRLENFGGNDYSFKNRATFEDTPEKRQKLFEGIWQEGGFKFWLAGYHDMLADEKANREVYNFWRDKTRAKLKDERLRNLLAPMEPIYPFGCKRVSLENGFYEMFNQPNVHLVDVNETPIEAVTGNGLRTSEKVWDFDFIVCATGYDAITGGLLQMDIRGVSGETLKEHWKEGTYTYLGMSVAGFPNMLFTYGPQGPTSLCIGPTCAQLQGDWIVELMNDQRKKGWKKITAERESEVIYRQKIYEFAEASLLSKVKSWYMGYGVPGKIREPLLWLGGVPAYYKLLYETAAKGYPGFKIE